MACEVTAWTRALAQDGLLHLGIIRAAPYMRHTRAGIHKRAQQDHGYYLRLWHAISDESPKRAVTSPADPPFTMALGDTFSSPEG
jgi:hypothetical protein